MIYITNYYFKLMKHFTIIKDILSYINLYDFTKQIKEDIEEEENIIPSESITLSNGFSYYFKNNLANYINTYNTYNVTNKGIKKTNLIFEKEKIYVSGEYNISVNNDDICFSKKNISSDEKEISGIHITFNSVHILATYKIDEENIIETINTLKSDIKKNMLKKHRERVINNLL